jgi:hypothetical protein
VVLALSAAHANPAAEAEGTMNKIINYGAIALTLVGADTLMPHRAEAGPARLDAVDTVACRRGDHQTSHHCARVVPRADNQASRLDEAGQPESRRRFSRW